MTNQHPITPPPELVEQRLNTSQVEGDFDQEFATFFAQWGADQELEACCKWVACDRDTYIGTADRLHAARRPKPLTLPLTLKDQALALLEIKRDLDVEDLAFLRRALETIND
jgi:hypothetical protein